MKKRLRRGLIAISAWCREHLHAPLDYQQRMADANETRDWRIYAEFAHRLITQARTLYAHDSFGIELTNTSYALDSTTIDLCLSLFPWALFRTTKSAVKMHTLLDLRGKPPHFLSGR